MLASLVLSDTTVCSSSVQISKLSTFANEPVAARQMVLYQLPFHFRSCQSCQSCWSRTTRVSLADITDELRDLRSEFGNQRDNDLFHLRCLSRQSWPSPTPYVDHSLGAPYKHSSRSSTRRSHLQSAGIPHPAVISRP